MDVIVVCRTLNEERNIELFCEEYSKVADTILICDGGSEDKTIELAEGFAKVQVVPFKKRVHREGIWRNPHGLHINFMIYWAKAAGAEWIIFDDCDSVPNKHLKRVLPRYFANPKCEKIMVRRLYLYKDEGHFPAMAKAGYSRLAWRSHVNIRACEEDPWNHHMIVDQASRGAELHYPSCLLHYSFPHDEEIARKAAFYRIAKEMPDHQVWHPSVFGGKIEPLPTWAVL